MSFITHILQHKPLTAVFPNDPSSTYIIGRTEADTLSFEIECFFAYTFINLHVCVMCDTVLVRKGQSHNERFWLRKEPKKCRCCLSVGGSVGLSPLCSTALLRGS